MKRITSLYLGIFLIALTLVVGCSKKTDLPGEGTEDSTTQVEEGAVTGEGKTITGEVTTGEELTEAYVRLVCSKYDECQVPGFDNTGDCQTKITEILLSNPEWKDLKFSKTKMDSCLNDVRTLSCDDFKAGKTPASCTEV
jgi:hypothetical protein